MQKQLNIVKQNKKQSNRSKISRVAFLIVWLAAFMNLFATVVHADDWVMRYAADSQMPIAIIDEVYLDHQVKSNGDVEVIEDITMTINSDMTSLIFIFDYSRAINLEMTSVNLSVDKGEGFSVPADVPRRGSDTKETVSNAVLPSTTYQLVRSSDQNSLHILDNFQKGSRAKIRLSYALTAVSDRYSDAGILRRYLVDDDFSYPIQYMKARFNFPPSENGEPVDFTIYPLYRWQRPLNYKLFESNLEVGVELFEVPAHSSFELVLAYDQDAYPAVLMTDDSPVLPGLDRELNEIRQRQMTIGAVSGWLEDSILYIVSALALLAIIIVSAFYFMDVMRGRRNIIGPRISHPPLGISPCGLSFLMRRKVTGQDIYAVLIELVSLGLFNYDKNIFTIAEPVIAEDISSSSDDISPRFIEESQTWLVYGRKGAVCLDQNQYIIWKSMCDLGRNLDGFSPAVLEKMSRKNEFSGIYYRFIADYAKAVKDELAAKGLFDKHLRRTILLTLMSALYLILAVFFFVMTWNWLAWLILIPGICLAVLTLNIRSLSGTGHWTLHHSILFKRYLTSFSTLPAVQRPPVDSLISLLIYAISFGCEAEYIDELYKTFSQDELIAVSFFRRTGMVDLLRSNLATPEKDRQTILFRNMKQRFREGRVDMIGMVFNSKHFFKL